MFDVKRQRVLREIEMMRLLAEGSTLLTSEICTAPIIVNDRPAAGARWVEPRAERVGTNRFDPAAGGPERPLL